MTTAREFLNELIDVVTSGAYHWDDIAVVLMDEASDNNYDILDIDVAGNQLCIMFKGRDKSGWGIDVHEWLDEVTINALERNDLGSLEAISGVIPADLREIRNLGWKRIGKVVAMMKHNGYPDWGSEEGD